jgi:transposase InsO family protein
VHRCFHRQLGSMFWRVGNSHNGQRCTVTSALKTSACTNLGIKHVLTTAYHPQSNGMVEGVHRQLKDAIRACGVGPARHYHLP